MSQSSPSPVNDPEERRQMTVMFVDLVGSTAMAEENELETVRDVTRRYQAICGGAIQEHGGHVAGYRGDGIVAYFGFPAAREDDARRAVQAGLDMLAEVHRASAEVRGEHGVDLDARVGIHTGLVLLTRMGSDGSPDPASIVGATPNRAARIEAHAPAGCVVISDATLEIVRGYFAVESLGTPPLKGVARDIEIFRVIGPTGAVDRLQAAGRRITPFVGRRPELDALRRQWQDVDGRSPARPRIVVLRGEAGIGKSRIVREAAQEVAGAGATVLRAHCSADHRSSPLHPVVGLLERHLGIGPADGSGSRLDKLQAACRAAGMDLAVAVPVLGALVGADTAGFPALDLDPLALRQLTFGAITDLVLATTRSRASLVVVEDAHWSDRSTLELVGALGAASPGTGLLVVLTARPDFEAPWSAPEAPEVRVDRMPAEDHVELVGLLADIHGLHPDAHDLVVARSDGNPLFTEELARSLGRDAGGNPAAGVVPATIRDLVTARLDGLAEHKRLAQLAATIGRDIDVGLLESLGTGSMDEVFGALEALVVAGVLETVDADGEGGGYRFVHALVRDAAYDSLERSSDRPAAHLQVAQAMVRGPRPDPAVVARHFDSGGAPLEALQNYVMAAVGAQGAAAHIEAIQVLDRALELAGGLEASPLRDGHELGIRILRGLSTASVYGFAAAEAAEDYRRGLDLSTGLGAAADTFAATMGIWAYYAVKGDHASAGEAVARLYEADRPEIAAEVLAVDGIQQFFEGRLDQARRRLSAAIAAFESRVEGGDQAPPHQLPNDTMSAAQTFMGLVSWFAGDPQGAEAWYERAIARARELPFPTGPNSEALANSYAGFTSNLSGRFVEGLEHHQRVLEIAQRYGFAFWIATGTCQSAISRAHLGDESALEVVAAGIDTWRALGAETMVPAMQTQLAALRLDFGLLDEALADVDAAIEGARARGEGIFLAEAHRVRAAVLGQLGAPVSEVAEELERSQRMAADQGAAMLEQRALFDLAELSAPA